MVWADNVGQLDARLLGLEQWRDPSQELRIFVDSWLCCSSINDQFVIYPRRPRMVLTYAKRIGMRATIRKIRSRLAETGRNQRVYGLGLGRVVESFPGSIHSVGSEVLFLATNHSQLQKTIVLRDVFVARRPGSTEPKSPVNSHCSETLETLRSLQGWSPHSGVAIDSVFLQIELQALAKAYPLATRGASGRLPTITDRIDVEREECKKPTAVLFGLGNYAKTIILPSVKPFLAIKRIHELDPAQFAYLGRSPDLSLDTSPHPRSNMKFDVWLIAGYHHTHTELAIAALKQGAYAVIEKPLATTQAQFNEFQQAVFGRGAERYFLCFHKRYAEFNQYIKSDLQATESDPIDMHCIVYEIPLPDHHWYNWPNSRSRLTSNGCHWLDFFMFVNDYSEVIDVRKWQPRGMDLVVQVRLNNGAYLSMSLTDAGSQRLGVRDYIELRHGGNTVSITDSARYVAESANRVTRRCHVNPLQAYVRMYQSIGSKISSGKTGDQVFSLASTGLTLLLEDQL